MKHVYYIKFLIYFICIFLWEDINWKIGFAGLAILMLFFATQISIEDYIDKKFAEKENKTEKL